MPSTTNQYQYKINSKKSNIDFQYGVYSDLNNAKENLLDGGMANNLLFDNGYTFAIYENNEPVEYVFHNIGENTTVLQVYSNFSNYVKKKVTDTTWDNIQNKPDFKTVATSGSYSDLSSKPQINGTTLDSNKNSAELGLMGSVSTATNGNIPVFSNSGQVSDSGKLLANVVFFGETITPNRENTEGDVESEEPDEPVEP